jgi:excisionase family DNA binding protein
VNSPEILDVIDAAAFLRVSPATVRTALAAQRLPGKRIGKEWRLSRTALIQWLSEPGEPRHYPARRRSDGDPSPPVPLPTDVPRRRAKRTSRKAG